MVRLAAGSVLSDLVSMKMYWLSTVSTTSKCWWVSSFYINGPISNIFYLKPGPHIEHSSCICKLPRLFITQWAWQLTGYSKFLYLPDHSLIWLLLKIFKWMSCAIYFHCSLSSVHSSGVWDKQFTMSKDSEKLKIYVLWKNFSKLIMRKITRKVSGMLLSLFMMDEYQPCEKGKSLNMWYCICTEKPLVLIIDLNVFDSMFMLWQAVFSPTIHY